MVHDRAPVVAPARSVRTKSRILLGTLTFILLAAGIFALWALLLRENLHVVVPGQVYRSAQPSERMLRRLHAEQGIRSVINLRGTWAGEAWFDEETKAAADLGIVLHHIDLATFNLAPPEELRKLVAALDECPKPLLIHCRHGADRTSLAVAIYRVLYEGTSLDDAMNAYQLVCGHTGMAFGRHLPHLFEDYRHWLRSNGREHSPAIFREWIGSLECVGQYGARVAVADHSTVADGPVGITFEVTNVSRYPWKMQTKDQSGISLLVRLENEAGDTLRTVYVESWQGVVEPSQTIEMHAQIDCPKEGGAFQLRAELVDDHGFRFGRLGCPTVHASLDILPADALANMVGTNRVTVPKTR